MRRVLLAALFPLILVGCSEPDMRDLKDYVADVKARPPSPIPPLPEVTQAESFQYVAGGRRDPFVPELEGEAGPQAVEYDGPKPDPNRRKEELESYSLDNLRMVGTLAQNSDNWGLVQTNDGTIHRVKSGNYMGRNHGRIIRINEQNIELTELVPNGSGGWIERQQAVALSGE